ncbi:MAG: MurR/RpiR family transcriptional regulator [Ectothiorhodospiraceae bacterium]
MAENGEHQLGGGRPSAPETLEGLQSLVSSLSAGTGDRRLGKRALTVLSGMVAAPRQAAVYSISELAEAFGVHASTLTRLAKALGYRGFSEFQAVFRRHVAQTGHFYSGQASRLREITGTQRRSLDVVSRIARDERANIQGMLNNLDAAHLEAAVRRLARAPRVRTLGLRQSYSLANFLSYALGMLRDDVSVMNPEHGVAHSLGPLDGSDLLVAIGFAPYTRLTVTSARIARERGIPIVAITDSYSSPLAGVAEHTFVAPAGGHFFSNSMAGAVALMEALLALVAQEMGDEGLAALQHREALIRDMEVEL